MYSAKMKNIFKWAGLAVGLVLLAAAVILAAAGFYLESQSGQKFLKSKINSGIPGRLDWTDLQCSLISGRLELDGLSLSTPDRQTVVQLDRGEIAVSLAGLIRGELHVPELVLRSPSFFLSHGPDRRLNLTSVFVGPDDAAEPEEPPSATVWPSRIRIGSASLETGRLEYVNETGKWIVELADTELEGLARLVDPGGNLRMDLNRLRVEGPELSMQLVKGELSAGFEENRLDVVRCRLNFRDSFLALNGQLWNLLENPAADLTLDAGIDLAELRRTLHLEPVFSGSIQGRITLKDALNQPTVSADLKYGGGELGWYRIDGGSLSAELKDHQLRLHRLSATAGDGTAELEGDADLEGVFPNGLFSSPVVPDALDYSLSLEQKRVDLGYLLVGREVKGVLDALATVRGRGVSPERLEADVKVEARARDFAIGGVAPPVAADLTFSGLVNPSRMDVSRLEAQAGSLRLQGNGELDRSSLGISADARLDAPDLGSALSALGLPEAKGAAHAVARISGTLTQPVFNIDLDSRNLSYEAYTLGDLKLKAQLSETGLLSLSEFEVMNRKSAVSGSGTVKLLNPDGRYDPNGSMNLKLKLEQVKVNDFLTQQPVQGVFSGNLELGGALGRPRAQGTLTGAGLAVADVRVGDVEGRLRFSGGTLFADRLHLKNRRSTLTLSGSATLVRPDTFEPVKDPAIDLQLDEGRIQLGDFTDIAQGAVSARAKVTGTFLRPFGEIRLEGSGLRVDRQPIDRLTLKSRLEGDRLTFEPLRIDLSPGESIVARGSLNRNRAYQVGLEARDIRLESIQPVADMGRFSGNLSADINGSGTLDKPSLSGDLALTELRFNGQPLDAAALRLEVDPRRMTLAGTLGFDVRAELDWQNKDYFATAKFDDTPLSPYFALAGRPELSGQITGTMRARGNLENPIPTQADMEFTPVKLSFDDRPLLYSEALSIQWENDRFTVSKTILVLAEEGRLELEGDGQLDGNIRFTAEGDIPLGIVARFTNTVPDITGRVSLSAAVSGALPHPDGVAEIRMEGVGFTIPALLQQIRDMNGEIRITPGLVAINALQGKLESGTFDGNGTVSLDKYKPKAFDLTLNTKALPVSVPDTLDLKLDSLLTLTGNEASPKLSGNVVIAEGLYYRDFKVRLVDTLDRLRRPKAASAPTELPPILARTALDVTVSGRKPFTVDNNVALLAAVPDLKVSGTVKQPVVSGRTEVQSGVIRYNKQEFTVTRGVIDFVSPYRIEPVLDISAETEIREWTIVLDISGTPDNLRFQLSSNPPESDEDILSLLAFGKTSRELVSEEGTAASMPKEMLASLIAERLTPGFKGAAGIDSIDVEYRAGQTTAEDEIKVTLGKELSRRLSVRYGIESKKGETVQQVTTEYKLLERLVLSAFEDTAGNFGGELQFRIEFR